MFHKTILSVVLAGATLLAVPQFANLVSAGDDGAKKEPAPIKLSGSGQQATSKFTLPAGFSSWYFTHEGKSNFIVKLMKTDGSRTETTLNEIGRYKGAQAIHIPKEGQYLVNVEADGKWTVAITRPQPDNPSALPTALMGKGPSVSPFITLPKGVSTFKMTHGGQSSFRVRILDRDGKYVDQAAGVIGAYNGSKAITIEEEGTYVLNISGDGEWSVKIE